MCSTHIGTFVVSKEIANAGKRIQSKDNCTLCGSFRPLYTQTQTSRTEYVSQYAHSKIVQRCTAIQVRGCEALVKRCIAFLTGMIRVYGGCLGFKER